MCRVGWGVNISIVWWLKCPTISGTQLIAVSVNSGRQSAVVACCSSKSAEQMHYYYFRNFLLVSHRVTECLSLRLNELVSLL